MAVDINMVYQKVQMMANKEQRGYMTPQEFNLMADKAQNEIFEEYFSELKRQQDRPSDESDWSDQEQGLHEKLSPIAEIENVSSSINMANKWRVGTVSVSGSNATAPNALVRRVTADEFYEALRHPFTSSGFSQNPVMYSSNGVWKLYPPTSVTVNYYREPTKPKWGYVVVKNKALYNPNTSTHFELHRSEEELVVNKILELAGVIIMKPGIMEIGQVGTAKIKTEQNK